ncbi:C40 family peptidase [Plantactinospora sp. S1510]|uniref:C40 family peptidase n=1 Tax=Plantactinospora alkalitolerans TaxID=2789879 RepID=A0ABS0H3X9_9ACTN|nr:C40 family peptidase [Plantactinospora alkalitolerans]MBF9133173.1 C40 family peptidase [Plantactinospora alkalitolerans]
MHSYAQRSGWLARRSLVPIAVLAAAMALTPATASATPDTSAVDAAGPAAASVPGDPPLPEYPGLTPKVGTSAAVSTTPLPCADNGSDKTMRRAEAITRARSWLSVGGVPYSQSRCYENRYGDYRTDCSGFVAMAWGLGGIGNGFWTGNLDTRSHPIARSDLQPGDALLRHTGNTSENHVALFVKWGNSARTTPVVIEQTGSSGTIERTWTSSYAGLYTPVRYDKIAEDVSSEDIPVSGDWNKDGIDTIGVFRPSTSTWYLRNTNSGDATIIFKFGHGPSGDIPVVGDWNKDNIDTVGVFRPSESTFYLTDGTTSLDHQFIFGHGPSGDIPVAGDWNKDNIDTVGVFRPGNSTFYLTDGTTSLDHQFIFGHGPSGDIPVAGDWNKDYIDTVGVFRPGNSTWYLTDGTTSLDYQFIYGHGPSGDIPVPGDWNKDDIDTPGVRRPGNNTVYLRNANSAGGVDEQFIYGI